MNMQAASEHLERVCQRIAEGRQATRLLTAIVRKYGLSEGEFRLLWHLRGIALNRNRTAAVHAPDQTLLAAALGLSVAQVSSLVESLREKGFDQGRPAPHDRRRQLWSITPAGMEVLERIVRSELVAEDATQAKENQHVEAWRQLVQEAA